VAYLGGVPCLCLSLTPLAIDFSHHYDLPSSILELECSLLCSSITDLNAQAHLSTRLVLLSLSPTILSSKYFSAMGDLAATILLFVSTLGAKFSKF
jgi:hypothetical protein